MFTKIVNLTQRRKPCPNLKVLPCKFYNSKYMIASTQVTNTEIFAFIVVLVCKLFSHKILFINRKYNRNC